MLVATWLILTTGEIYRDPSGAYFTRRDPERQTRRLVAHGMTVLMGLDQHRAQITGDWIDTDTGEGQAGTDHAW